VDNNPEEARGAGAQLDGQDATSAATTNPAKAAREVGTAKNVDSFARQPGAGASTRSPKRTLDTEAATASAFAPKRPRRACTMELGIMLLSEHSYHLLICPCIALH
jgi:hypothetical protein